MKDFEDIYSTEDLNSLWELFLDYEICSEETLETVRYINGFNSDLFKDILYARTGLRSLEQLADEFEIDLSIYGLENDLDEDDEY